MASKSEVSASFGQFLFQVELWETPNATFVWLSRVVYCNQLQSFYNWMRLMAEIKRINSSSTGAG